MTKTKGSERHKGRDDGGSDGSGDETKMPELSLRVGPRQEGLECGKGGRSNPRP